MPKKAITKKTAAKSATPKSSGKKKGGDQSQRHLILLADSCRAHVYEKTSNGITRVLEEDLHCSVPVPGEGYGRDMFLRNVAEWLNDAARNTMFGRVAIIAPAQELQEIQSRLDKATHTRLCAALPREIDEITEDEIEDHLSEVVWV